MKISVITVCKNAVETIEETLLSLYKQSYGNIEHIVIDGCSDDGTLEVLSKYRENISILLSEPDTGIYNAMNKAIKLMTGDIVYFLNANDSLYDENALEKVVKEFQKHPDLGLLWGDVQFIEHNEDVRVARFNNIKTKSDLIYNNPCHQVIFYSNEIFKKYGGYDEKFIIYADCDFNIRMLVQNDVRCKYIPEILARFELGGLSTSAYWKDKILQKKEINEIYKKNFSHNLNFRIDKFFTKTFGTPTRATKKTRLWNSLFKVHDAIYQSVFNERLSLNLINNEECAIK